MRIALILTPVLLMCASRVFSQRVFPVITHSNGINFGSELYNWSVGYTHNHWSHIGAKRYSSISGGIKFFPAGLGGNKLVTGPQIAWDQHMRISWNELLYVSYGIAYCYAHSFRPIPEGDYRHDVNKHQFNTGIGVSRYYGKCKLSALAGVGWVESKQDLGFNIHTYLRVYPSLSLRLTYFPSGDKMSFRASAPFDKN